MRRGPTPRHVWRHPLPSRTDCPWCRSCPSLRLSAHGPTRGRPALSLPAGHNSDPTAPCPPATAGASAPDATTAMRSATRIIPASVSANTVRGATVVVILATLIIATASAADPAASGSRGAAGSVSADAVRIVVVTDVGLVYAPQPGVKAGDGTPAHAGSRQRIRHSIEGVLKVGGPRVASHRGVEPESADYLLRRDTRGVSERAKHAPTQVAQDGPHHTLPRPVDVAVEDIVHRAGTCRISPERKTRFDGYQVASRLHQAHRSRPNRPKESRVHRISRPPVERALPERWWVIARQRTHLCANAAQLPHGQSAEHAVVAHDDGHKGPPALLGQPSVVRSLLRKVPGPHNPLRRGNEPPGPQIPRLLLHVPPRGRHVEVDHQGGTSRCYDRDVAGPRIVPLRATNHTVLRDGRLQLHQFSRCTRLTPKELEHRISHNVVDGSAVDGARGKVLHAAPPRLHFRRNAVVAHTPPSFPARNRRPSGLRHRPAAEEHR